MSISSKILCQKYVIHEIKNTRYSLREESFFFLIFTVLYNNIQNCNAILYNYRSKYRFSIARVFKILYFVEHFETTVVLKESHDQRAEKRISMLYTTQIYKIFIEFLINHNTTTIIR